MTDAIRLVAGAMIMLLPLLVATYYRRLATAAFQQAKNAAPPAARDEVPSLKAKIVAAFLSVNRGGGPEFFLTPNWMVGLTDPAGRQQATAFKRYRLMFWLFMASAPAWFMLVSRWLWR